MTGMAGYKFAILFRSGLPDAVPVQMYAQA